MVSRPVSVCTVRASHLDDWPPKAKKAIEKMKSDVDAERNKYKTALNGGEIKADTQYVNGSATARYTLIKNQLAMWVDIAATDQNDAGNAFRRRPPIA